MRSKFLSAILSSAILAVSTQLSAGQIKGKTINPETKAPAKGIFAIARLQGDEAVKDNSEIVAVTGDDGAFSLNVPDNGKSYEIIITDSRKDGFIYEGFAHISKSEDLGVIELRRKCSLSGKVLDDKNSPVPRTTVKAEIRLKKYTCTHYAKAAEVKTSADGSFEFKDLAPREYRLSVDSDKLFCEPTPISVTDDLNYVEFKMKPGCSAAGKIITQDGKPVPGVKIYIGGNTAVSGTDGTFKISGLKPGEQHISISEDDYVLLGEENTKIACSPGKTAECTLTMVTAGRLAVLVSKSKPDLKLPENITVTFSSEGARNHSSTTSKSTDLKDGKAEFKGIKPGTYKLEVKGDKNLPKTNSSVVIEAGKTAEIKLETAETFSISGKVVDENSNPVKSVSLNISPADGKSKKTADFAPYDYKNTDDNGTFSLDNLLPGKYVITVEHEGWMKSKTQAEAGPQNKDVITIKLDKGLSISGQVLEADGTPVPELSVSISGNGTDAKDYIFKNGKTDDKGSFCVSGLSEGKFDVRITDKNYINTVSTMTGVKAGSDGLLVTLAPKQKIEFIAADEDGKPVADAEIKHVTAQFASINYPLNRSDGESLKSGKDGKFAVELRQGDKYVVSASKPPLLPGKKTIDLTRKLDASTPLSLVLMKGLTVSGKAVDPSGKPVKGLFISSTKPVQDFIGWASDSEDSMDVPEKQPLTDDSGNFKIDGLAPGVTTLYAMIPGRKDILIAENKFDLKKDGPAEIKMEIPEIVKLKGSVLDTNGKPASDGIVNVLCTSNPAINTRAKTGEKGSFEIPRLPVGKYSVSWYVKTDGKMSSGIREIQVSATTGELVLGGKTEKMESNLLKGTLTNNGSPVEADISFVPAPPEDAVPDMKSVIDSAGKGKQSKSDENGNFKIEGLGAGKYIYSASSEKISASGRIEIKDPAQNIVLKIESGTLKGKVSLQDGTAASEASIELSPAICNYETLNLAASGEAAGDGSYSIGNIQPGKYNLVVWHSTGMGIVNGVVITGKEEKVLDIKLDKGFKISGKILLDSGKPADGAQVIAINENNMPAGSATVNPDDGSYSFEVPLPKGKYRLFAVLKDYSVGAIELEINADVKFDATLCKAGSARLNIKDPSKFKFEKLSMKTVDGKNILRLVRFSPSYRSLCGFGICINDPNGETVLTGLRPGDYILSSEDPGKQVKFTVKQLEAIVVEIQ